jgi:hypothetical protein
LNALRRESSNHARSIGLQTHQFDALVALAAFVTGAIAPKCQPDDSRPRLPISAAIGEPPTRSAVMDERYQVAISRLGNRAAGIAELGRHATKVPSLQNPLQGAAGLVSQRRRLAARVWGSRGAYRDEGCTTG